VFWYLLLTFVLFLNYKKSKGKCDENGAKDVFIKDLNLMDANMVPKDQ